MSSSEAESIGSGAPAARYWHRLENGRFQCDLCPRECQLSPGQRGFCFVRMADHDGIRLDGWGRASGYAIDPVEKKPLNHFLPGTPILSFGTAGCNLACRFCQNWTISHARSRDRLAEPLAPAELAQAARQLGCRSIAYTYNDPVIFSEYAIETAAACRQLGIASVAVTAGYIQGKGREELFAAMDAANVDLKSIEPAFYRRLCAGALEPVLETLVHIHRNSKVWLELTCLVIPGENDSEREIRKLCEWIGSELDPTVPLHLTAFHPDGRMTAHPPTPRQTLLAARRIAIDHGLKHVYTGNLHDPAGQSTHCANCGKLVIGRDGYRITAWALDGAGCCRNCGRQLDGRFDPHPGDWGARRQGVVIERKGNHRP